MNPVLPHAKLGYCVRLPMLKGDLKLRLSFIHDSLNIELRFSLIHNNSPNIGYTQYSSLKNTLLQWETFYGINKEINK